MAKFHELDIPKREILLKKVLKYMHRRGRPVMIGEVAVELRESIELIEDTLDEMAHSPDPQVERVPVDDPTMKMLGASVPLYRTVAHPSIKIGHLDLETDPPEMFRSRPPVTSDPVFCTHANEAPASPCPCGDGCYCRAHTCRQR